MAKQNKQQQSKQKADEYMVLANIAIRDGDSKLAFMLQELSIKASKQNEGGKKESNNGR